MDVRLQTITSSTDIPLLSEIAVKATRAAFEKTMPSHALGLYLLTKLKEEVLLTELNTPTIGFCFVMVDNIPVGYVKLVSASQDTIAGVEFPPNSIRLDRLYLLPEYTGKGIGTTVLKHILITCFSNTAPPVPLVYLTAYHLNKKAHKLYQRLGFEYKGEVAFHVGDGVYNKDYLFTITKADMKLLG